MNMKEVADITGIAESTVRKYAPILGIAYVGSGMRKIYIWEKSDIPRLKKAIGKRGRPKSSE